MPGSASTEQEYQGSRKLKPGGTRVAWDGQAYTHEEFVKYYGYVVSERIWLSSLVEVPEVGG